MLPVSLKVDTFNSRFISAMPLENARKLQHASAEGRLTVKSLAELDESSTTYSSVLAAQGFDPPLVPQWINETTEKILRPDEFAKRLGSTYSPSKTLVKVFLRSLKPGHLRAIPGLRLMRRLPHFHSVAWMPPVGQKLRDMTLTTGYMGIAFFVGESRAEVIQSVEAIHDLEDRGLFFDVADCKVG
ncbi:MULTISPECIES: hypothetical protein [Brevibacterium]|uniref:hypothetical protein n=1 Tax=Brevibacterium TaxID=1696 RepID=UPI002011F6DD|nr:hypothetical protein [Brevibacterium sp. W7.2]